MGAQGARLFLTYLRAEPEPVPEPTPDPGLQRYAWLQTRGPEDLLRELRGAGVVAEALETDLADTDTVPRLFDAAEEHLGSVAVLVHRAAHWEADSFSPESRAGTIDDRSHDRHFAVNSRATALLIAEFARCHSGEDGTARAGRVDLISTDGASGHAGAVSYGASKHAMESLARAAAWELGPRGIRVNVIAPGPVQTGCFTAEEEEELSAGIPLRRIGRPEDVAHAAVFLASEQAGWITGQLVYVGGGNVMLL